MADPIDEYRRQFQSQLDNPDLGEQQPQPEMVGPQPEQQGPEPERQGPEPQDPERQDQEVGDAIPQPEQQQPERLTAQPRPVTMPRVFAGEKELKFDPQTGEEIVPAMEQYHRQMALLFNNIPPALKGQFVLQQISLTQSEKIQMQRQQNAISALKQAYASGDIDQETMAAGIIQIQTKLNPNLIRNARATAMGKELANKQSEEAQKTMQKNLQGAQEFYAQNSEKRIASHSGLPGEDGHQSYTQIDPKTGLIHAVPGLPGSKEFTAEKARADDLKIKMMEREDIRREKAETKADEMKAKVKEAEAKEIRQDEHDFKDEIDRARAHVLKRVQSGKEPGGIHEKWYEEHKPEDAGGRNALDYHTDKELERVLGTSNMQDFKKRRAAERRAARSPEEKKALGEAPADRMDIQGEGGKPAVSPAGPPKSEADTQAIMNNLGERRSIGAQADTQKAKTQALGAYLDQSQTLQRAATFASKAGDQEALGHIAAIEPILLHFKKTGKISPEQAMILKTANEAIRKYKEM